MFWSLLAKEEVDMAEVEKTTRELTVAQRAATYSFTELVQKHADSPVILRE